MPRLPVRTAGQFGEDDFHARHSRASVAKSKRADVPDEPMQKAAENAAQAVVNAAQSAREDARGCTGGGSYLPLLCSLFVLVLGLRTYPE